MPTWLTEKIPSITLNIVMKKFTVLLHICSLVLFLIVPFLSFVQQSYAASLTEAAMRLDRMGAGIQYNTTTGYKVLIVLKPTTVGSIGKVRVTFPTTNAFSLDTTPGNFDTSVSGLPSTFQGESLTAATITNNEASAVSGGAVTFDVTSMSSSSTLYGFYLTCNSNTCLTNPSAGNAGTHRITIETLTSGSSLIDSQSIAVQTVVSNADQIAVSAAVPSAFAFSFGSNSISLGSLSANAQRSGSVTIDVDTNAYNGWFAWIRSEGAAATLASASTGDAVSSTNTGSCVDPSRGSEAYLVDVNGTGGTGSGTLTIASEYNCADTAGDRQGGVISTSYEQIASRNGSVDSDLLTVTALVDISSSIISGSDYTDTWEIVGAGNF